MAKFDLIFIDAINEDDTIQVFKSEELETKDLIQIKVYAEGLQSNYDFFLDKSTAIKFAKTLRTEINKITESEVSNG